MDDASDGELVRCIAEGGSQAGVAERQLCQRFLPRIRLYGLRHLRDADRAQELVQMVLLGLLTAARSGRIEELTKVDRFVLGTCRNAAHRVREQGKRFALACDDQVAELAAERFEPVDTGALLRCFDGLDVRAKQVMMMTFQEERSADEIAHKLALSSGNVRVLRHRALLSLRRCLDGEEAR
jgi:RNA polymerase sigma-70 factor, ECF subfamily